MKAKRSQLTWWEDAAIALCVWLATLLSTLQISDGRVGPPGRSRG